MRSANKPERQTRVLLPTKSHYKNSEGPAGVIMLFSSPQLSSESVRKILKRVLSLVEETLLTDTEGVKCYHHPCMSS